MTEGFCSFFSSVIISRWDRMFLDTTQTNREKRHLAQGANFLLLTERSWESRLIVLRNTAFTDAEEVFVLAT